jgi:hypothetical protein
MATVRLTLGDDVLDINLDSMMVSEGEDCERLTGWTVPEWGANFIKGRARAVKFAYWLALSRAGRAPDFTTLDFDMVAMAYDVVDEDEAAATTPADLGVTDDEGPTGPEQEAAPAA